MHICIMFIPSTRHNIEWEVVELWYEWIDNKNLNELKLIYSPNKIRYSSIKKQEDRHRRRWTINDYGHTSKTNKVDFKWYNIQDIEESKNVRS